MSERIGEWVLADESPSPSGKTRVWQLYSREKPGDAGIAGDLGEVRWYGPWRKYTFQPLAGTVFEQDCLRAIAAFCEMATRVHRAEARRERS